MCLQHLKKYEGVIGDLVRRVEQSHNWINNQKKEVESLKGRVLDLEMRNILLEAKVFVLFCFILLKLTE